MIQEHRFDAKNNVHVYNFKRASETTYKFRGIIPNFDKDDILRLGPSLGFPVNTDFKFTEVLSVEDSKGIFKNEDDKKNSLIEAVCEIVVNP